MKEIRSIITKELIAIWKDKKSRVLLVGFPILQLIIYAHAITFNVKNVSLGILNNDSGQISYELEQKLIGSDIFTNIIHLSSEKEMKVEMDRERILVALQIQDDFSRKIHQNKTGNVMLVADGRKPNSSLLVMGYFANIIDQFNKDGFNKKNTPPPRSELKERYWYNPNLIYPWYTIYGLMGTILITACLNATALSIVRETEMGTLDQLFISPASPTQILSGKAIPGVIIGLMESSILMIGGYLFFDLPLRGNLILFYLITLIFILSLVGLGLIISSIVKTQQQAILGYLTILPPMFLMSGFISPLQNMPEWMQYAAMLNPLKYYFSIVLDLLIKGVSPANLFSNLYPLFIIGCFTVLLAFLSFRYRLAHR